MKTLRTTVGFTAIMLVLSLMLASPLEAQEPNSTSSRAEAVAAPTPLPPEGPIKPQIVGGTPADPGEYPWQAALVYSDEQNPLDGQFCGGSLIGSVWVLTAAHCVEGLSPTDIDVVLGINILSEGPNNGSEGRRIAVDSIMAYPDYDPATFDMDIALLHLADPASGADIHTIGWVGPENSDLFRPGVWATVTGWGATSDGGPYPDVLLEVAVPIVSNATCNAPQSYDGAITDYMLCAGLAEGGKDGCQGDSGGPLVVSNGQGGWLQAGVVSWGEGCALPDLYGVYARLSQFSSWIDLQVYGSSPGIYLPIVRGG